jgi:hypothetical protein
METPIRRSPGHPTRDEQLAIEARNKEIEKMLKDNLPGSYIARYFNVDEAIVSRIKKAMPH